MKSPVIKFAGGFGLAFACTVQAQAGLAEDCFKSGVVAYSANDFTNAATAFHSAAFLQPASGSFQNFGNTEWQLGNVGDAILAWERALWLNPSDANARNNLRFARDAAQLEAPELRWYEFGSTWLPANLWPWILAGSLWLVGAMMVLPIVFRWRKTAWQQAVAALGLGIFLLTLPASLGVATRARLGFILEKDVPLRLTPTENAEAVTRLAAGEPGRFVRKRGNYVFIRTSRNAGWVEREQLGLVCP